MTDSPIWSRSLEQPTAIHLPTPPGDSPRASFPLLATIAPVIASLGLWAVTQSPFALVFALLGPIVAIASLGDSSWHGRRHRRRETARFDIDAREAEAAIRQRQSIERAALDAEFPTIRELIDERGIVEAWRGAGTAAIRIGTGDAPSPIRLEGAVARHRDAAVRERLVDLERSAGRLPDGAVVVDPQVGLGYCGPEVARVAAARASVIRLARSLDPTEWSIRTSGDDDVRDDWSWLDGLPHRWDHRSDDDGVVWIGFTPTAGSHGASAGATAENPFVAIAATPDSLPRRCGITVAVASGSATVSRRRHRTRALRPELVTAEQAYEMAVALTAHAIQIGLLGRDPDLAAEIPLSSLANPPSRSSGRLSCEVGGTADGAWTVDLVADGPHAVIGGVTGSGKSELLTSWLLAMATRYSPDEVTFLLVDFKGGATFGAISLLPHSVGLITDLDRVQARRALESLRAELALRERTLAAAKVRSIEELGETAALARLVIVVDEFAALSGDFPELRELFADLAARGRSLGIHLILCTQRPAATLRDAILANCTLRICLRVNDPADSIALLGTGDAAALPRSPVGRALVSTGGEPPTMVQVAIAALDDAASVAVTPTPRHPVRRPWCDALPSVIDLADIARRGPVDTAIPFGILDLPESQRQMTALWEPRSHGNLFVLGGFGSGKSAVLSAIAAGSVAPIVIPADVEGAWDRLLDTVDDVLASDPVQRIVLIDDIDALVARFGVDHQREFVDAVLRLVRDGPGRGAFTALSSRSIPSALAQVASACDSRLILRMPDRSEHVVAGGRGVDFDERMPPGGGFFRGDRVQVGWTAMSPDPPPAMPVQLDFGRGAVTAVISAAPREFVGAIAAGEATVPLRVVEIAAIAGSGELAVAERGEHLLLIGDLDAWQSAWAILPGIRSRARLVFHRASVADYRSITRARGLPPALSADPARLWVLDRDDSVRRAVLPRRTP